MPSLNAYRKQKKSEGNKAVHAISQFAPLEVKRAFVEQNYDAAMLGLKLAIEGDHGHHCGHCGRTGSPEPWALRAWLEAAGAVGSMQQVVISMHASFGVRDEDELRGLVESGRKLERLRDEDVDLSRYRESAVEMLRLCFVEHPEWRENVVAALSSEVRELESHTNGSANGTGTLLDTDITPEET